VSDVSDWSDPSDPSDASPARDGRHLLLGPGTRRGIRGGDIVEGAHQVAAPVVEVGADRFFGHRRDGARSCRLALVTEPRG